MKSNEEVNEDVWKSLGAYISKQMKSGKGVTIPKLGTFTFT
jgi:nucleoid DNA-binding protein